MKPDGGSLAWNQRRGVENATDESMVAPVLRGAENAAPDGGDAARVPKLGATIRRLRLANGLTLQELAERSGVSVGMLSQLERDRANPSLRVLSQVRDALGASMSALFADSEAPLSGDPGFVCRAGQRPLLDVGYLFQEILAVGSPGGMQMTLLHLPPGADAGGHSLVVATEKGGLVLEGAFLLSVDGSEALLGPGDSFLFDGTLPHSFRNPENRPAKVLWVMSAPRAESHR